MSEVITLAERHRRKLDRMQASLVEVDGLLTAYARQHGGRFIRYGSTAKGRMRAHSDVDVIADFEDEASIKAASYAEELCFSHGLVPDVRPSAWTSDRFLRAVAADGVILA